MVGIKQIEEKDSMKEMTFNLNTVRGTSVIQEAFMQGKLNSVILELNKQCDILIRLKDHPEIELLNVLGFKRGTCYLPLRTDTYGFDGELFNFQNDKWLLNDNVEVIISGGIDTEVKFIFRFE